MARKCIIKDCNNSAAKTEEISYYCDGPTVATMPICEEHLEQAKDHKPMRLKKDAFM